MKFRHQLALALVLLFPVLAGAVAEDDAQTRVAALETLGESRQHAGDLAGAEASFRSALEAGEAAWGESLQVAATLARLGDVVRLQGRLDEAEKNQEQALAIRERLAPDSLQVADSLHHLFLLAHERGDLEAMAGHVQRAQAILKRWPADSLAMADNLNDLGMLASVRGDLKLALDLYQQALAMHQNAAGQDRIPMTLQQLGRLHLRMGHPDQAAQLLAQAVEALETRAAKIGGSHDAQAGYRASYEEIYRDAIDVELARGHATKAFHLLERSRARSFLTLLAERDLAFGELPEALERSRRDVAARYDRKLRELTQADGEEAKTALERELDRLRQERDEIAEKIRAASPRLVALREPRPLGFQVVRELLDPGTLALSYSVGKDKTVLFAVTRKGDLQVRTLPLGEERLRREIESFLERVRSQQAPAEISAAAADLYRELIGPVAELVERSERVLILPDGPLHRLPFGALVHDGRFLIEEKPLHTALSLTVYITLRVSAPAAGPTKLVAFGDPLFPKSMRAKSGLGPGLRGFDWSRLPYSRSEVERIAGVHPGALVYLGEEATEERVKSIREARILHFATHGYTDDRTPLDSALVLTVPEELSQGRENGLLQVWEIFDKVRIDADLVVLSACESALGRELSGEGLIGLTRAFQYAGARSVAASLWSVADQVTAELMTKFHRHLAAGLPKDQALRAAQIELIREPLRITTANGQAIEMDASAPFFWAAFQLFGDWR